MSIKQIIEENQETLVDKWGLNYIHPSNGKFYGNMYVTDKNIYFEAEFGVSLTGVQTAEGGIFIPRSEIKSIEEKKVFFIMKQVHITLNDNKTHIFDRGIMSVQGIVKALQ